MCSASGSSPNLINLQPKEQLDLAGRTDMSTIEKTFDDAIIFNLGMPKSGTGSLHDFFLCRKFVHSSHHLCGHTKKNNLFCGACIEDAVQNNLSLENSCGYHSVYNQMDVENADLCSFPQMKHLAVLRERYPHGKFILLDRDPVSWLNSVLHWTIHMELRLLRCFFLLGQHPLPPNMTSVPRLLGNEKEWKDLYNRYDGGRILTETFKAHSQHVLQVFQHHAELQFVHLHLTDCELEQKLNKFLNFSALPNGKSCMYHEHQTASTPPTSCEHFS